MLFPANQIFDTDTVDVDFWKTYRHCFLFNAKNVASLAYHNEITLSYR